jgi:eukaryotic-like serine/threonine-protein kinase
MIGETLGRYRIDARLGAGGMGVVYRAYDTQLGRVVAIKLLGARFLGEETARIRLLHEARTASRLNHAHICTIHEVGEAANQTYIVMECVEGRPLNGLVRPAGLPPEMVVCYGTQIAEALAHAHERGIVHRDLKTANVMITTDGRAKVLDFGLARRIDRAEPEDATRTLESLCRADTVTGTPHYLSPEVLHGRSPDEGTDLWALGVMLYEMACGGMPFEGVTQAELLSAILTKPPFPLTSLVTPRLRAVIERCLTKEPARRYQKATELCAALEGVERTHSRPVFRRSTRIRSLAVLPLADLSGDVEQAYFADGMTEALITDLAKIGALKVISRTSAMRYKGSNKPLPEIARELGVDGIIEGSVLRTGGQVRITAQLIHAASDTHVWAESYDRDLTSILSVQSEVAQAIAQAVHARVTPEERGRLAATQAVNPAAHSLYLKGRYFWNQRGPGLLKSVEFFQRALKEDPNHAPSHAGLADAYGLLGFYGYGAPMDVMPKAKDAARKALALDPGLAEAHASLGYLHTMFDWDWKQAEKEFQQAFKLNLGYGPARYWHSLLLLMRGQGDKAIAELKLGLEYDPPSVYMHAHVGSALFWCGRWAEGSEQSLKALEWDPNFLSARCTLGACYFFLSRVEEAIHELQAAVEASRGNIWAVAYLAAVYAASGNHERAYEIVRELEERRQKEYISAFHIATVYVQLGKVDESFKWLDEACQERAAMIFSVHRYPFINNDAVLHDPRFADLMQRIGVSYDE